MDYHSAIAIALGAAGIASSVALYRWAKKAPAGYEDSDGFHYGDGPVFHFNGKTHPVQDVKLPQITPAPAVHVPAGVEVAPGFAPVDWSKPLELSDGTPVVLCPGEEVGLRGGTNPDSDGHYWVAREDGQPLGGRAGGLRRVCAAATGRAAFVGHVRNRAACDVPPAGWECTRTAGHDGPCAGVPANSNVPALTDDQRRVLLEMNSEIGHTAATLQRRTGLPHKRVVAARRELAGMGLAVFGPLYQDCGESNVLAGRGYILTPEGDRVQDVLFAEQVAA